MIADSKVRVRFVPPGDDDTVSRARMSSMFQHLRRYYMYVCVFKKYYSDCYFYFFSLYLHGHIYTHIKYVHILYSRLMPFNDSKRKMLIVRENGEFS